VVYFTMPADGGGVVVEACLAHVSGCTPTPINMSGAYREYYSYGGDLYALDKSVGPIVTVVVSSLIAPTSQYVVLMTDYTAGEFAVDATGVYWTLGSSIVMGPSSGCVGAPVTVAANQASPSMLRPSSGFLYWVNGGDGGISGIMRVAEPIPPMPAGG
jgi:hypothetical protein